jgi:copper ion binding protein
MPEQTVEIPIKGMSCEHCVRAVTQALKAIPGVREVQVSLDQSAAIVTYDDTQAEPEQFEAAIVDEGYGIGGS